MYKIEVKKEFAKEINYVDILKTILSKYGDTEIKVPQDKEGTFEPQIVKNVKKIFLI